MPNNMEKDNFAIISKLIENLCDIILTDKDCFEPEQTESFIKELTSNDMGAMNLMVSENPKLIDSLLFKKVADYIDVYQVSDNMGSPFVFDSGGNYEQFRKHFEETYLSITGAELPFGYNYVFDYIQDMSQHYRVFEKFYAIRSKETFLEILSGAKIQAEMAVKKGVYKVADEAADRATSKIIANAAGAEDRAKEAKNQAEDARLQAEIAKLAAEDANTNAQKAAEIAVDLAVDKKMTKVSSQVSESSVTILGIFAGIVLTVVAGLFYSSSVLESVNSANFFRLTSVASLVGLVCYHLIALMFRSIEKIKDSNTDVSKLNRVDKIISIFLIGVITVTGVLQFVFPTKNEENTKNSSGTSIYAEVDVNTKQDDSSSDSSQDDEANSVSELTSSNVENSSSEISTNSN